MYKIIGGDQKEYGPVPLEQISQWIGEGRANAQTLICTEGSSDWRPLGTMPELASALASAPQPSFAPPPTSSSGTNETTTDGAEDNRRLNLGQCFQQGWLLLRDYPSLVLGVGGLVLLIQLLVAWACPVWNVPIQLPASSPTHHQTLVLPVWASLVDVVIRGILYGGFLGLMLRLRRGTFTGFRGVLADLEPAIPHLVLGSVVSTALTLAGLLLFILPGIYLAVAWAFLFPVVLDQRKDFWSGMELSRRTVTRQWWRILGLLLIIGGLNLLASQLHPWLVFLSLPYSMATLACAYETLFRRSNAIS